MQVNKKLFTITVTALLLFSMLAVTATAFASLPSFTVTPSTSSTTVGTKISVSGSGASSGGQIQFYWDTLAGVLLNSTYASGDSSAVFGPTNITIPDSANGNHYIIAYDNATGSTATSGAITINAKITASPTTGIPGDSVVVTGTGFSASKNGTLTISNSTYTANLTSALVLSSVTGNYSITFTVPAIVYGTYTLNLTQTTGVNATVTWTCAPTITLTPTSGPQGSVVAITGRGFNATAGAPITLTINGNPAKVVAPILTITGGTFSGSFVMNVTTTISQQVNATDGVYIASANFTIKGVTGITATPSSAPPGTTITIAGTNFTAIAGTPVTIQFATLTLGTLNTNAAGAISGTFAVPSLPTTGYTITATDTNGLTASTPFTIAITLVTVSPTSGATGSSMLVTAYGFTNPGTANVTLGSTLLGNVSTATLNSPGISFVVPQLAVGTYTLTVVDNLGLTGTTSYAVTVTSTLTAVPSSAPAQATVNVTANNFGPSAAITFTLKNSTAAYVTSSTTTNATGYATVLLVLPSNLALGSYTINATDNAGFTLQIPFTVIPATVIVNTRASTYSQGDVLSFNIQMSFAANFIINIYDPQGTPSQMSINSGYFTQVGSLWVYPYTTGSMWGYTNGGEFPIATDAVTGTWTWNATAAGVSLNGTFTVVAKAAAVDLGSKLDAMNTTLNAHTNSLNALNTTVQGINTNVNTANTNLNALNTTVQGIKTTLTGVDANVTYIKTNLPTVLAIAGDIATIKTSVGTTLSTQVSSLGATLSSIQGSVASITMPNLGPITTSLAAISAKIDTVSGDTATISTSLGTITTSLSDITTGVTGIHGDTATIQTSLGTLSGKVDSVSGNVATITTNLGTIQADISGLKSDVSSTKSTTDTLSPLIIIAIVLALIAAIAAIASIFLMRRKIAG